MDKKKRCPLPDVKSSYKGLPKAITTNERG